ncbi:MAG: hypothetical protein PVH61_26740 [Candidatus Aminicenantes bacterium]
MAYWQEIRLTQLDTAEYDTIEYIPIEPKKGSHHAEGTALYAGTLRETMPQNSGRSRGGDGE